LVEWKIFVDAKIFIWKHIGNSLIIKSILTAKRYQKEVIKILFYFDKIAHIYI